MKKYVCILLSCLILFIASTANAATPQKVNVKIDGVIQTFTQPAVIISSSVMVPMRPIFEKLGAKIKWNAGTQTVTATKEDISIKLIINKQSAYVNGKEVKLTVKPVILNGSTLVPLRFVSESLGGTVHWNNATKTATINTTGGASGITDLSTIKQFALKGTTEITQSVKAGDSAKLIYSMFDKPMLDYQYRDHQFVSYKIRDHDVTFGYLGERFHKCGIESGIYLC
jgi:hypothetical protein